MTDLVMNVRIEIDDVRDGQLQVVELEGTEAIGKLFELQLTAVAVDAEGIDADALTGAKGAIVFERGGLEVRRINGMIVGVRAQVDPVTLHERYRLTFGPRSFRMTLHETLDIFMGLSVPEIIKKKLLLAGLEAETDFRFRLHASYPPREFVVQYKETDLAFVSRLCEHLGISFFFEHEDDRDVIVFTDASTGFSSFDPVAFHGRGEPQGVRTLETSTRLIPAQHVVRDYNYRMPQVDLTGIAETKEGYGGRVIEYGAHFKTPKEGEHIARLRAEESEASRKVYLGESDLMELAAGATSVLEGHPWGDLPILVVAISHRARQSASGGFVEADLRYANTFRATPADLTFRPPRVTPKPKVQGVITGVIDASNAGQYAELDDEGRYRVRFLFDTSERNDGQASRPVRMVQPHSGPGYGVHFPLRSGVEVVISCVDGDPDRPIIVGTVPNPLTASPVAATNAPRNIIRTGGGNEINIDDTEGSRRIKLTTPHAATTFQLGAPNAPEAGALLETQGAASNVALVASSLSLLDATLSALQTFTMAGTIRTVAEAPDAFAYALTAGQVATGALDAASSALELTEAELNRRAEAAEEAHKETAKARDALVPDSLDPSHDLVVKKTEYETAQTAYEDALAKLQAAEKEEADADEIEALGNDVVAAKGTRDAARNQFKTALDTY